MLTYGLVMAVLLLWCAVGWYYRQAIRSEMWHDPVEAYGEAPDTRLPLNAEEMQDVEQRQLGTYYLHRD